MENTKKQKPKKKATSKKKPMTYQAKNASGSKPHWKYVGAADKVYPKRSIDPKFYEDIAVELEEWSKNDEVIFVDSFALERDISVGTFREWTKKNESLASTYQRVKRRIGERRMRKGLTGEFNARLVERTQPLYDQDYKEWVIFLKKIGTEGQKQIAELLQQRADPLTILANAINQKPPPIEETKIEITDEP